MSESVEKMKNFGLIGVGGYIAPRHLRAIKDTGNRLVAAVDRHDSVGIMDSYFPDAAFFTEFERFDRHVDKLRRIGEAIDFISIVSPNYLHDAHIRFALRNHAHAICEKPLVLSPWNIDALEAMSAETGYNVYSILQLRLHESVMAMREKVRAKLANAPDHVFDVDLTYLTSRGHWYFSSWKGDEKKSGGIATNIGVHFYDMLLWIFGTPSENIVHISNGDVASGFLGFKNARVSWFLSVNADYLPVEAQELGKRTFRNISIDGEALEFSEGFTELHTESYKDILGGGGFGLAEARPSIELVHAIRNARPVGLTGDSHPFAAKVVA